MDAFNPITNLLAIDLITASGLGVYKDVRATVHSYTLLAVDGGVPQADFFDPATNLLTLGAVTFEGSTYNNVRVKINAYALLNGDLVGATTSGTPPVAVVPPTVTPQAVSCVPAVAGSKTWEVGSGLAYPTIGDVDWNNLQAGDVVRIHWRATPYAEKILLSSSGTTAKPIRVCGVPGGPNNGDSFLPVITGANATTRSDLKFENDSHLVNGYSDALEPNLIVITNGTFETKPANIVIEGLHLTGANENTTFKDVHGIQHNYIGFSACIFLHKGDNVVIRGNELSDCGHAVFALSKDYEPGTSRNLLIEGNYLHGNGATNSAERERVHGMYIQTVGVTLQYNYFGPHRAGAMGGQYKDRSVGSVVRYNFFTPAARVLDFVEQTDYDTSIDPREWDLYVYGDGGVAKNTDGTNKYPAYGAGNMPTRASVVAAAAANLQTYVYGNFIRNTFIEGLGAYSPVHWGGDQDITNKFGEYSGRHGKLYFFNNTVASTANYRTDGFGATRLSIFDLGKGSNFTNASSIEAYNNVIHFETTPNQFGQSPDGYLLRFDMGVLNLGKNWITSKWQYKGTDIIEVPGYGLTNSGVVNGTANLIKGATSPVNAFTLLATTATEKVTLKAIGQALPAPLANMLDGEFQVNHRNPLLSIKAARNPATASDMGAAAIP